MVFLCCFSSGRVPAAAEEGSTQKASRRGHERVDDTGQQGKTAGTAIEAHPCKAPHLNLRSYSSHSSVAAEPVTLGDGRGSCNSLYERPSPLTTTTASNNASARSSRSSRHSAATSAPRRWLSALVSVAPAPQPSAGVAMPLSAAHAAVSAATGSTPSGSSPPPHAERRTWAGAALAAAAAAQAVTATGLCSGPPHSSAQSPAEAVPTAAAAAAAAAAADGTAHNTATAAAAAADAAADDGSAHPAAGRSSAPALQLRPRSTPSRMGPLLAPPAAPPATGEQDHVAVGAEHTADADTPSRRLRKALSMLAQPGHPAAAGIAAANSGRDRRRPQSSLRLTVLPEPGAARPAPHSPLDSAASPFLTAAATASPFLTATATASPAGAAAAAGPAVQTASPTRASRRLKVAMQQQQCAAAGALSNGVTGGTDPEAPGGGGRSSGRLHRLQSHHNPCFNPDVAETPYAYHGQDLQFDALLALGLLNSAARQRARGVGASTGGGGGGGGNLRPDSFGARLAALRMSSFAGQSQRSSIEVAMAVAGWAHGQDRPTGPMGQCVGRLTASVTAPQRRLDANEVFGSIRMRRDSAASTPRHAAHVMAATGVEVGVC